MINVFSVACQSLIDRNVHMCPKWRLTCPDVQYVFDVELFCATSICVLLLICKSVIENPKREN